MREFETSFEERLYLASRYPADPGLVAIYDFLPDVIASSKSLRSMEVCMPISLEASIEIDKKHEEAIKLALLWVRHVGVNRNRGLGRCTVTLI